MFFCCYSVFYNCSMAIRSNGVQVTIPKKRGRHLHLNSHACTRKAYNAPVFNFAFIGRPLFISTNQCQIVAPMCGTDKHFS